MAGSLAVRGLMSLHGTMTEGDVPARIVAVERGESVYLSIHDSSGGAGDRGLCVVTIEPNAAVQLAAAFERMAALIEQRREELGMIRRRLAEARADCIAEEQTGFGGLPDEGAAR